MWLFILIFIFFLFITSFLFYIFEFFYSLNNNKLENFEIQEYKKLMLNNDGKNLYKISLDNIPLLEEDCFDKCDRENCIKLSEKKKNLEKCLKCNRTENKCFSKSIIGGLCNDCDIKNYNDKLDCYSLENYGCINPTNLDTNFGVKPYYIEIPDDNVNSPYNKKCVFCWNILNEF